MVSLLLIEDDASVRRGMELALARHGYDVRCAATGEAGWREFGRAAPDLVLLDLMLPGIDGIEVCRRIRAAGDVPVIITTARDDELDIVSGLEAGADDYVVKPTAPSVVDARIRAVLRRSAPLHDGIRQHGDLRIDTESLTVTLRGAAVALTATELQLLLTLTGAPERVFSRQQLLEQVWEHDYLGDSRLVDNCVQRLRAKIETDPSTPRYVQTVRGFGYRFGPW